MIDFYEELKKYKPILEIDSIEEEINLNAIQDMMEILKEISENQTFSEGC